MQIRGYFCRKKKRGAEFPCPGRRKGALFTAKSCKWRDALCCKYALREARRDTEIRAISCRLSIFPIRTPERSGTGLGVSALCLRCSPGNKGDSGIYLGGRSLFCIMYRIKYWGVGMRLGYRNEAGYRNEIEYMDETI